MKTLKSNEAELVTLKARLEAREALLLARGLAKERHCHDPIVRHITAESRSIQRSIAAHIRAHESAAERAARSAKLTEGKSSKLGKEPKAAKAPEAANEAIATAAAPAS